MQLKTVRSSRTSNTRGAERLTGRGNRDCFLFHFRHHVRNMLQLLADKRLGAARGASPEGPTPRRARTARRTAGTIPAGAESRRAKGPHKRNQRPTAKATKSEGRSGPGGNRGLHVAWIPRRAEDSFRPLPPC